MASKSASAPMMSGAAPQPAAIAVAPAQAPESAVAAPATPAAKTAVATGFADVNTDNSLISNGSVTATSDTLLPVASAFRREVYRLGGRVVTEQVHYHASAGVETTAADTDDGAAERESAAVYRIKILPRLLPDVLDWLGKHAAITNQDVSSIVAMESETDAAIVRADVQQRVAEIDAELSAGGLEPAVRAAREQERSRLIGATIADPNAQADNTKRVAVLEVRLEQPTALDPYAGGKMFGETRGSFLGLGVLGNARGGSSTRIGAGVGIGGRSPVSTLEVIGYSSPTMDTHAGVSITMGVGRYSRAFGGGHRSTLNPYIGVRAGYAYFDASYLEVAAEVGVELVKERGIAWTVSARPMGLVGTDSQAAIEVGSSVGLAF